jgi:hypothetical protein
VGKVRGKDGWGEFDHFFSGDSLADSLSA